MPCSRRDFFSLFARSVASNVIEATATLRGRLPVGPTAPVAPAWVRPPGALPEPAFRTTCTRCTACQEACPYGSIRRLGPEFGDIAGTPVIIPAESPCYLCDGLPCIAACEPLALQPVAPRDVTMGTAVIDDSACYAAAGQPCDYCHARCPLKNEAITMTRGVPRVTDACVGCGVCAYLCPPAAITIHPTAATIAGDR